MEGGRKRQGLSRQLELHELSEPYDPRFCRRQAVASSPAVAPTYQLSGEASSFPSLGLQDSFREKEGCIFRRAF